MKYILFLILSISSFLNLNAESILFLGDSITAGYGLDKEQAYPALIQEHFSKNNLQHTVINAGVSGNTSAGGLRRVEWYFKRPVHLLVLALGANDGLRGIDPDSTYDNLEKIILLAKEKNPNIKILLTGMKVPPNMGQEFATKFEAIFPKLAEKNQVELLPFLLEGVAGHGDFNLADGIHPNIAGQKKIAGLVLEKLLPLIKAD
jgi:acyl-CoA thioesterase I